MEPAPQILLRKIISGGQTGVDRGALDAALALGIEHGGSCPRGRLAEDGQIPAQYRLQETESRQYHVRTRQNVLDADGTLILCRGELSGGTRLTHDIANNLSKPCCVVDLNKADLASVMGWLAAQHIQVLNVAGPRESQSPGIGQQACEFLQSFWRELTSHRAAGASAQKSPRRRKLQ